MFIWVCAWVFASVCTCVKARGQCGVSSSVTVHLNLRQDLSLSLELTNLARLASGAQRPGCLHPSSSWLLCKGSRLWSSSSHKHFATSLLLSSNSCLLEISALCSPLHQHSIRICSPFWYKLVTFPLSQSLLLGPSFPHYDTKVGFRDFCLTDHPSTLPQPP